MIGTTIILKARLKTNKKKEEEKKQD